MILICKLGVEVYRYYVTPGKPMEELEIEAGSSEY